MNHRVVHFDRIDSTNTEARRLAEQGERGPLWLWADAQTGGRGRLGRRWVSEPGNLYATCLFSLDAGPEVAGQVGFVAALAVHDLISAMNISARIKWPNDILIGGAKVAGLLAEVVGAAPTRIAQGFGINVAHAPANTPYPVTALALHGTRGEELDLPSLLSRLANHFSARLAEWDAGKNFAATRAAWTARAAGFDEPATATIGDTTSHGIFRGLAADGALVLELPGGARKLIHAGDVRIAAIDAMRELQH